MIGSGKFVEHIIQETDSANKCRYSDLDRKQKAIEIINKECKARGVSVEALQAGSRRSQISKVRAKLSLVLVEKVGLTLAEAARLLGVTTSAVVRAITSTKQK